MNTPHNWSPLHVLCLEPSSSDVEEEINEFLHHTHTTTDRGTTPLHFAALNGNLELVQILTKHNAPVVPNFYDESPLHWAAQRNHASVVAYLLDNGAQVNQKDESGDTPLHWAAETNAHEVSQLLLERGAQCDVVNERGQTPLDVARFHDAKETSRLLLRAGASVNDLARLRREEERLFEALFFGTSPPEAPLGGDDGTCPPADKCLDDQDFPHSSPGRRKSIVAADGSKF